MLRNLAFRFKSRDRKLADWWQTMWRTGGGAIHEPLASKFAISLYGQIFVDIGANTGYYTHLLASNFKEIIAIEADPFIAEELRKVVPNNCMVLNVAVSDHLGTIRLDRAGYSGVGIEEYLDERDWFVTVPCKTLTDVLRGKGQIDLVKMDVEGAEWQVLEGAKEIMAQVAAWIIELHDPTRRDELASLMAQHGYSCKWLDEGHGYFARENRIFLA